MKRARSTVVVLGVLLAAITVASAATTNLYVQNWGTGNTGVTGDGNLGTVGWTAVAVTQTAAPYIGIFVATGASDAGTGEVLPANTVYFTDLLDNGNQTTPGMIYTTTESGAGVGGNSVFEAIDPTLYTNLTLSVEVRGAATDTNYFAVRAGGQWYVSTNQLPGSGTLGYPMFTNAMVPYTNIASAWRTLTINATDVTIGGTPASDLSGPITGIGIVELPTFGGFNYNRLAITAFVPGDGPTVTPPTITIGAISQTTYEGGGAQFLVQAAGTSPLNYIWTANGAPLTDGAKYLGTSSNILTILNVDATDAAASYSVIVTNAGGGATNSGFTLTVNPVPDDFLYAETYPYIGPNGDIPIATVGWLGVFQGASAIYTSGVGIGNVFSYSGVPTTNIYFTTTTNDTGSSGLPFVEINPDNYPNVTFQANFTPGNADALNPTNVIAYWAAQMADGNWYVSANRVPVQTTTVNNYQPYQMVFSRAASNWNTLTILANSAAIGGQSGGDLMGNIIGAGIVMAHQGGGGGGDVNFNTFVLTTNEVTVLPPTIGVDGSPWSQEVASGGGVSFGVSATGAEPFSYGWTLNGVPLINGGRISGANTRTLTIANVTTADTGDVVAFVTNSAGSDRSDNWVGTFLTVTNPNVGVIYTESFPFVGPLAGSYPVSSAGWVEAVPNVPNALYQNFGSDGAVFAFLGSAGTVIYYATTASDMNQAGLRFPNVNLAGYSDLNIAVDIAPAFSSSNVTAYVAVQINGSAWYVAASPLPVPTAMDSGDFATYDTAFNPAAANWRNLTVTSSGALIGSAATNNLTGVMTGAGLVFVTVGTGGTFNFDNFIITGTGVGGINLGAASGGSLNLTWVGNPAVSLQSSTNVASMNWDAIGGTAGAYSTNISLIGPQMFFRLIGP